MLIVVGALAFAIGLFGHDPQHPWLLAAFMAGGAVCMGTGLYRRARLRSHRRSWTGDRRG